MLIMADCSYLYVLSGGLDEFIQRVSQTASDDLAVQLKIYNDLKEADFDEFQSKWHGVQSDMLDVNEIFNVRTLVFVTRGTEFKGLRMWRPSTLSMSFEY